MGDKSKKEKKQAGCILCTVLLLGIIILLLILYFSLFRPRDPKVQVPTMQLISLTQTGGGAAGVGGNPNRGGGGIIQSVTLNLQVSMYNPNRADFFVDAGSTACLYYNEQQVGFTPIPPTSIPAQSFSTASIALSSSAPISPLLSSSSNNNNNNNYGPNSPYDSYNGVNPQVQLLPLNTSVTILGHVTTGSLFSHHSDLVSKCCITIALTSAVRPFIQSYTCERSYSLDE